MAGWTAAETALWIRGQVQVLQDNLNVHKTGRYDRVTNDAFKETLVAAGYEDRDFDNNGPGALASVLWPDVFGDFEARYLAVAWAWWARIRNVRPAPTGMLGVIEQANTALQEDGDEPLTASVAGEFVGDGPVYGRRTGVYVLLASIGLVVAGYVGTEIGKRKCHVGGGD